MLFQSLRLRSCSALLKLQQRDKNPLLLLLSSSIATADEDNGNNEKKNESTRLPPPIRVSFTEFAGRGTFATRRIGSGDLIHTAKPLISHPSLPLLDKVCYLCLKKLGTEASTRCTPSNVGPSVIFCSEECREHSKVFYEVERRADWSAFDDHCRQQGLKYPFLVRRLACMVISGAASVDILDVLQPTSLFPEMILEMEEEFGLLKRTFMEAGFKDEEITCIHSAKDAIHPFLNMQWYIGVLARIRINAFRIELVGGSYEDLISSAAASVTADAAVGNAVYMLPSFYNHDCDPNAHIIWIENANARLKALRDIEAGEELFISYIDASMDCDARQELLSKGFGFKCRCLRCTSGD